MKSLSRNLFLLLLLLLGSGCMQHDEIEAELERAARLVNEEPQHARILLDSLPAASLREERLQARYAVLRAMAYDKSYATLDEDSTMRFAVDYYRRCGTPHERAVALYHLGRIHFVKHDYEQALLNYMEAERFVDSLADPLQAGLIYVQFGLIYAHARANEERCEAFQRAYDLYHRTNCLAHQRWATMDLGLAWWSVNDHDAAEQRLREALERARKEEDRCLEEHCYNFLIQLYGEQGRYAEAERIYEEVQARGFGMPQSTYTWSALAWAARARHDGVKVAEYARRAAAMQRTLSDSIECLKLTSTLAVDRNDYRTAYRQFQSLHAKTTRRSEQLNLRRSLLGVQRCYLEEQVDNYTLRLQSSRRLRVAYVLGAILSLVVVIQLMVRRIYRKNQTITHYMTTLDELQQRMSMQENERTRLIRQLLHDKFSTINELGQAFSAQPNDSRCKERIYREARAVVRRFAADEQNLDELEHLVNVSSENIMQRLREQLPHLKPQEYQLLCYHYAGLTTGLIALLMQESVATIYKRRSRLRQRILQSEAPDRRFFVDKMS